MFSRESIWSVNICPDSGLVTGKDVAGGGIGGRGHTWDLPPQIFSEVKSQDLSVRNLKNILLYFISDIYIILHDTNTEDWTHQLYQLHIEISTEPDYKQTSQPDLSQLRFPLI